MSEEIGFNGLVVVKEADIRKKIDLEGLSVKDADSTIRSIVEKSGIDFGRTVYQQNESPNRMWANNRHAFEPTQEEQAVIDAEKKKKELAEMSALEAEKKKTAALEAELALLKKGNTDGTLHIKGKTA
jgi:hypothetical protein